MGLSEFQLQQLLANQTAAGGPPKWRRKRSAVDIAEAKLERICTQILIHDGWRPLKTDPVRDRRRGKGFGELGMADYLYIRYQPNERHYTRADCHVLWVEWKRETGEVAEHQKRWHSAERAKGALVAVALEDFPATVEGFADWYRTSGLWRGEK